MATSSVTELVQAVNRPRALSESTNRPLMRKSEGGGEEERKGAMGRRNSENVAPNRRNSHGGTRNSMQRISELPEKKPRKSSRLSFMGYNCFLMAIVAVDTSMRFVLLFFFFGWHIFLFNYLTYIVW
jgi:hypothetical protein